MPNHCYNIIESISHDDPGVIQRLKECLEQDEPTFLQTFVPCPNFSDDQRSSTKLVVGGLAASLPENEDPRSYWGTKWDVYDVAIGNADETSISFSFSTAWSPPTVAYSRLKEMGFTIDALFVEPGCDFCGYWKDGEEIVYENVSANLVDVPEEFHEYFSEEEEDETP